MHVSVQLTVCREVTHIQYLSIKYINNVLSQQTKAIDSNSRLGHCTDHSANPKIANFKAFYLHELNMSTATAAKMCADKLAKKAAEAAGGGK